MNPEPSPGVGLGSVSSKKNPKTGFSGWWVLGGSLKPLCCSSPQREQKIFSLSLDDIRLTMFCQRMNVIRLQNCNNIIKYTN